MLGFFSSQQAKFDISNCAYQGNVSATRANEEKLSFKYEPNEQKHILWQNIQNYFIKEKGQKKSIDQLDIVQNPAVSEIVLKTLNAFVFIDQWFTVFWSVSASDFTKKNNLSVLAEKLKNIRHRINEKNSN